MEPGGVAVEPRPPVESRFKGTPTPPSRYEIRMGPATSEPFPKGVIASNNGRIAAYDMNGQTIHIAPQSDIGHFPDYTPGDANVPLTGGDTRAFFRGEFSRQLAEMDINEVARQSGVKGRTYKDDKGYDVYTNNPFDDGRFLDTTDVTEIATNGTPMVHRELSSRVSQGKFEGDLENQIGRMNNNNGTLAWCTPDGRTQIAPYDSEIEARLRELGYQSGDIFVPHSNGEAFDLEVYNGRKTNQTWAELVLDQMAREGKTMTMQERNTVSTFAQATIPSRFNHLIQR